MRRILSVAALAVLAVSSSASAQRGAPATAPMPLEFGFDAGLSFGTGGTNNETSIDIPIKAVRVGFHFSPTWSIEPSLGYSRQSDTDDSFSQYAIGVGALYHFSPVRTSSQIYARPFVNLLGYSTKTRTSPTTTVTTSDNLNEVGIGLGAKLPWRDRLAFRLEGNVGRLSKNVASGQTRVGILAGMSYFTR